MKLQVIKKVLEYPCYCCRPSIRGKTAKRKDCLVCDRTGQYKDEIYYHVVTDKKGNKICLDGDSIK